MNPPLVSMDSFLGGASIRGERSLAWVRLWFNVLALVNVVVVSGALPLILAGSVKHVTLTLLLLAGCALSGLVFARLRRGKERGLIELTAACDGLLVVLVVGVSVWWPATDYLGFLRLPHQAVFPLALCINGLRLSPRAAMISAAIVIPGGVALLWLDPWHNHVAPAAPEDVGLFVILLAIGLITALAYGRRTRHLVVTGATRALEAERARQRLGVYVSPEIADQALAGDILLPGGDRREVAVLFSDLRGFTRYSESLAPERLVGELNAYLEVMLEEIRAEGGVVDKYIGDAIMVVFGIPEPHPDDAARAVRTAFRMQAALSRHNAERVRSGLSPLRQGIGIHAGEAVAGNIGTPERMQYTVIGDSVNLASRLESATQQLNAEILVSDRAYRLAAPFLDDPDRLQPHGPLRVPGRDATVDVWRA